jgi:lysozyme
VSLDLGLLASDLRRDEGLKLEIYDDGLGNPTIGYGHRCTLDDVAHYRAGISQATADSLLVEDVSITLKFLDAEILWWRTLPDDAQRGLANMAFNMGGRLLWFHNMLAALASRDFIEAASEAMKSEWAVQVGDRATRIAGAFRSCLPNDDMAV